MTPTSRTKLTRLPKRGAHDTATIYPILDEGLVCHVSYILNGQPFMIPIAYCRIGDVVYIHGSVGSHFLRELAKGIDVCLAVTLMDGLVLARSAFHHSVNYRSVILFGKTRLVTDDAEAWDVLKQITEHLIPGRWEDTRQPNDSEMKKTMVLAIDIEEASAKVRTGNVNDDPEDADLPHWAGVVPLTIQPQTPIQDPSQNPEITVPNYVTGYKRN
ncbi:pyridoxamine 5'-phosphate oxidase family protein [Fibrella aquatilis]|uniref:Pyridoxamine 5'-phosphate oxidase family protein n=1 Tax=Fibrella aquatilis TaxID=2817059 RepID=A0A939G2X8_9BACT|nr:pyridoxamine 5'-phosphate oxidase family protein [Fibrella aquatilis]MBO0930916.1 pyridoxamine 5'-phosphate oxidase family protein [Fibrella aquatilis]